MECNFYYEVSGIAACKNVSCYGGVSALDGDVCSRCMFRNKICNETIFQSKPATGPGSLLHSIIRSVTGEEPQAGCGCNAKIAEMNTWQYRTLLNPLSSTGAEQRQKLYGWMVEAANETNKRRAAEGRPLVEVPTSASMWGLLKAAWREWRKKPKEPNADAAGLNRVTQG